MLLEKILEEDPSYAEDLRNSGINSYHSDKRHPIANGHHVPPNMSHHHHHQQQQQQHYHHPHYTGSVHVTNI